MGMPTGMSRDTSDQSPSTPRPSGNPNPYKFEIGTVYKIGHLYIANITYPGCTNYEGRKILVLNTDPRTLTSIDPHFTEGGYVVARFAPDANGIANAITFVDALHTKS